MEFFCVFGYCLPWISHVTQPLFILRLRKDSGIILPSSTYCFCLNFENNLLVAQSCLTLCDPMDCSPPGSSVHGLLQARILEWVAIPFSRGSSWPRSETQVSHIAGRFFFFSIWASRGENNKTLTGNFLQLRLRASIPLLCGVFSEPLFMIYSMKTKKCDYKMRQYTWTYL